LRYANRVKTDVYELEPVLAECLGLPASQKLGLVHAYVEDPPSDGASHLLCQAVHLKPDMRNAIVLPLDDEGETRKDISIIIKDLNDMFKVDYYIKSVSDRLWVIHLKHYEAPDYYPHYLSVLGKKADQYLELSKQNLSWYRLINEIQMFMHAHEINQKRFEAGLLPINSLWCWGGGRLPELRSNDFHWYTSDELLKRYADKLGILNSSLEAFADDEVRNNSVCIELSILEALKTDRGENLVRLLGRIERQLFKPLVQRVKSRRCSLRLRACYRYDFVLSPYSALRFWKQAQHLHDIGVD